MLARAAGTLRGAGRARTGAEKADDGRDGRSEVEQVKWYVREGKTAKLTDEWARGARAARQLMGWNNCCVTPAGTPSAVRLAAFERHGAG